MHTLFVFSEPRLTSGIRPMTSCRPTDTEYESTEEGCFCALRYQCACRPADVGHGSKIRINDIAKSSRETKTISFQHQPVLVELLCIIA